MTQPTPTQPAQPGIPEKLKEALFFVTKDWIESGSVKLIPGSPFPKTETQLALVTDILTAIEPHLAPDAQRVAELEKDKARLDWLALDPYARNQRVRWELPVAAFPNESGARDAYRAAIDAAMSRTTEAKP